MHKYYIIVGSLILMDAKFEVNVKNSIIKDPDALGKITLTPYFGLFRRFDDSGKQSALLNAWRYAAKEKKTNPAEDEKEFFEILIKSVGKISILKLLSTVEGSRTYSWRSGCTIVDVVKETEMIERGIEKADTALSRNSGFFEDLAKNY